MNKSQRKRSTTKRKVAFGNPTLGGTYGGHVYTSTYNNGQYEQKKEENSDDGDDDCNDNNFCRNMVAITDVPPDQIPEGLLNLVRGHRSSIEHIRVLISLEDNYDVDDDDENDGIENEKEDRDEIHEKKAMSMKAVEECTRIPARRSSSMDFTDDQINPSTTRILSKNYDYTTSTMRRSACQKNNQMQQRKKKYLILITLQSSKAVDSLVRNIDGKPYNSFESDVIASVHYVNAVILDGDDADSNATASSPATSSPCQKLQNAKQKSKKAKSAKSEGGTSSKSAISFYNGTQFVPPTKTNNDDGIKRSRSFEKQNCAVCLEPMEISFHDLISIKKQNSSSPNRQHTGYSKSTSSIFTTVCNHSFHTECLLRCEDSPCPVCRYDHTGLKETLSVCHTCGGTENIHVCLICGISTCWNPSSMTGCARQHYDETLHTYAFDTETQHVWDFTGQGYVHRLIQNVDDGKIVEVSDPNSGQMERSLIPQLTDTQESEVVHRKLEGYASQYCTLLKSQLEQQRAYYEGVMDKIRREYKVKADDGDCLSELISALKQDRNQLQQRCHVLRKKRDKVADDLSFLKNMNESLEKNKEPLRRQIMNLQRQRTETAKMLERCLPSLEEKVASLMLELENDQG